MIVELTVLYCPTCRRDGITESPPCTDGHGDRCPDRACVECGAALLVDAPLFAPAALTRQSSRARRAA